MPNDLHSNDALRGAAAGAIATVGMTAAMVVLHRLLPAHQRYGLPPEQIVDDVLDRADMTHLSNPQFKVLSMAAHHGYGTTMGALYGLLSPHVRTSPVLSGACFGMAVWSASYLGWLPAMRMRASAIQEPRERNALTIATHLVWGGLTGLLTARSEAAD
jgi:putative membrane protein